MIRTLLACDVTRCRVTRYELADATWVVRLQAEQHGWRCDETSDLCPEHALEDVPDEHDDD